MKLRISKLSHKARFSVDVFNAVCLADAGLACI